MEFVSLVRNCVEIVSALISESALDKKTTQNFTWKNQYPLPSQIIIITYNI